jgi:hypothetical protein
VRGPAFATAALALALSLALAAGCHPAGDPVARLEVTPSALRLGYPEIHALHLAWQPLRALAPPAGGGAKPVVFVHLLDAGGQTARTFDHPFPDDWQPGTPVEYDVEIYQSALAPPLPAGSYSLTVGLYRPGGPRWPLEVAAPDRGRLEYVVAGVEVPERRAADAAGGVGAPGAPDVPRFDFTGDWAPLQPGTDIQVLATRWLQGTGAITVTGPPADGRVTLALDLPAAGGPATLLVLGGDVQTPSVMVTSSCGDTMTCVSGGGRHWVEVPLAGAEDAGETACEIRLEPNFYLVTTGSPVRRAAMLEVLGWSPGPGSSGGASGAEADAP